ncbi:MAG: hypothetical protein LAP21_15905 [Acidobacteriia bacterium]|nr:hypothetical protein [Terriglobia bacterium]
MKPRDRELALRLQDGLLSFAREKRALPGIRAAAKRNAFLEQILESIHRVKFIAAVRKQKLSDRRLDPSDELFDPLKAAILHQRKGNVEEAFWLVFLFVHFGKHTRAGWRYAREVYGRLGSGRWDWKRTSANPEEFCAWLDAHQDDLKGDGVSRGFGNHRKYESLSGSSPNGTGAAVKSYVGWINPPRTHQELMKEALDRVGGDPRRGFDDIYRSMKAVTRFGRTARFDYLTMVGKLGLAPIEPGSPYLQGSTGPSNPDYSHL